MRCFRSSNSHVGMLHTNAQSMISKHFRIVHNCWEFFWQPFGRTHFRRMHPKQDMLAPRNSVWAFSVKPKLIGKPRQPRTQSINLLVNQRTTDKCANRFVWFLFFGVFQGLAAGRGFQKWRSQKYIGTRIGTPSIYQSIDFLVSWLFWSCTAPCSLEPTK